MNCCTQMPNFKQKAYSIVDYVLSEYSQFGSMKVNDYRAFAKDVVSGIEKKIGAGYDKAIPLEQALEVFAKQAYLTALHDASSTVKDGAIGYAAKLLDISREHFSRNSKSLGIDRDQFKLGGERKDFGYFQQKILENIIEEKITKYGSSIPVQDFDELKEKIPSIGKGLSTQLNEIDIYQLYINRMSFVYKIAEDVLKDKYDEVKGSDNAYEILQNVFKERYIKKVNFTAQNNEEIESEIANYRRSLPRINFREAA